MRHLRIGERFDYRAIENVVGCRGWPFELKVVRAEHIVGVLNFRCGCCSWHCNLAGFRTMPTCNLCDDCGWVCVARVGSSPHLSAPKLMQRRDFVLTVPRRFKALAAVTPSTASFPGSRIRPPAALMPGEQMGAHPHVLPSSMPLSVIVFSRSIYAWLFMTRLSLRVCQRKCRCESRKPSRRLRLLSDIVG